MTQYKLVLLHMDSNKMNVPVLVIVFTVLQNRPADLSIFKKVAFLHVAIKVLYKCKYITLTNERKRED